MTKPNSSPPRRIQLSPRTAERLPPHTVKVDNTTKWGSPYVIHPDRTSGTGLGATFISVRTRQEAMDRFGDMTSRPEWAELREVAITELGGKNLACWCPLPKRGKPDLCHAAVLLEIANKK